MEKLDTSLEARYPDIAFLLSLFPYEETELERDATSFESFLQGNSLEEIEVLYVVGLVAFDLPKSIIEWLEAKNEHTLVFIEDSLGAFAAMKESPLYANPQIQFYHDQGVATEELSARYPIDRIAIYVGAGKQFDRAQLERKSAALSALYSDVLFSHKIAENVLAHLRRLSACFAANAWKGAFKDVPAIICGAGPSLEKAMPHLPDVADRALIFAGGSTITALSNNGVRPHIAMALDPNEEEFDRLKQASYFEGPFLFAPRLHKDVFATVNGPFGYVKSDTGGLVENYLEEKFALSGPPIGPVMGEEAFSVTTLMISYAHALGCNPIILTGVDLAYSGGKRYAAGVDAEESDQADPRALEKRMIVKDIHGNEVKTLLKWVMEADSIANFASEHREVTLLNASGSGIGFAGIENHFLEDHFAEVSYTPRDLDGAIHTLIQESALPIDGEKITPLLRQLSSSLEKCLSLCKELAEGSNRALLHEIDLHEEEGYKCFLEGIDLALTQILPRYFPNLDEEVGKEEREIAKYKEMQIHISNFLRACSQVL